MFHAIGMALFILTGLGGMLNIWLAFFVPDNALAPVNLMTAIFCFLSFVFQAALIAAR